MVVRRQCARCGEWFERKGNPNRPDEFCGVLCANRTIADKNRLPLAKRFWSKVDKSGACWLWTGCVRRLNDNYKQPWFTVNKIGRRAYRVAWELTNGPIPPGLQVMHDCDNPVCVRPDHLRLGTQQENMRDMVSRGRSASGERHSQAVFTLAEARRVKAMVASGVRVCDIAKALGHKYATVYGIASGTTWKDA
jgi:hypothetical protein